MDYKRLFLNWLECQGIRKIYIHNCRTGVAVWDIYTINNYPITYVWTLHPKDYILGTFRWSLTLEGESFWRCYHLQWEVYLNDYQSTH